MLQGNIHIRDSVHRKDAGFTLLELLISLTVVSLIVVIVFGSLRVGVRAWEKGEQDVDVQQRERIVLELMKRQLESISLRKIKDEEGERIIFKGENLSLEFLSNVAVVPGNELGMVYVRYLVETEEDDRARLLLYEKNLVLLDLEKGDISDGLDEEDAHVLISGIGAISFEYLKGAKEEETSQWQETWDMESEEGLPLAVRILFKRDKSSFPIAMIARMEVEEDV